MHAKREHIRLFAVLCSVHGDAMAPHLPKAIAVIIKTLKVRLVPVCRISVCLCVVCFCVLRVALAYVCRFLRRPVRGARPDTRHRRATHSLWRCASTLWR